MAPSQQREDVPDELQGRDHDAPGESPPTEGQGKNGIIHLLPEPAFAAANQHLARSSGNENGRPDPVGLVYIDRSRTSAFRTAASVDGGGMALDFRIRNLLRNDEVCPFVPALGTAEAQ
ncbi:MULTISPECIES: hypothetical protein [Paracidovorax]|uniref:hypothetical protein n=1 Tax=Paracidovorax TaxID=3051137 RepID=UPI0012EC84A7|nr:MULTISPECIES: hypothetical protein [Paracidovorax]